MIQSAGRSGAGDAQLVAEHLAAEDPDWPECEGARPIC